jgi:glycosyltransferase A (GT-A) superfamily protein (DUF2064 family)
LGPAGDGGFYLFAGKKTLPKSLWVGINYSVNTTLKELVKGLKPFGETKFLPELQDIDTGAEAMALLNRLTQLTTFPPKNTHNWAYYIINPLIFKHYIIF